MKEDNELILTENPIEGSIGPTYTERELANDI